MIETAFYTDDLPKEDRFACWHELTCQASIPTLIHHDRSADFKAAIRILNLGTTQMCTEEFPRLQTERTSKLINISDPEQYILSFFVRGTACLEQVDRQATVGPGDLILFDSSRPFKGKTDVLDNVNTCSDLRIQLPRESLPLGPNLVDQLLATKLSGRDGLGILLSQCLQQLSRGTARYRITDLFRLSAIAAELLAALLAHELDTMELLSVDTRERVLVTRILAFIETHLDDTHLTPDTIATAHHISTRHLHRLFQIEGTTVANWIRLHRLRNCRHDLSNPHLHRRSISSIAARWGFTDSAHFSRLFRANYGITAKDFRHQALADSKLRRHAEPKTPRGDAPYPQ